RPDLQDGYINRALARQGLKQFAGAIDDLTTALKIDDSVTRLYFMRSLARERAGDKTGAEQDFQKGLSKEPSDEKSWNARGSARLKRKDYEGALADFEKGLLINPFSRATLNSKVHVLSEKLDRAKDAVPVLDRILQLYPDYVPARSGRGVLHARLGNRD